MTPARILHLIRNWPLDRDDPDRAAKQAVVNEIGDAIQAEIDSERSGTLKTLGEAGDIVLADIAKRSGRMQ